jgi:hypothetical protein
MKALTPIYVQDKSLNELVVADNCTDGYKLTARNQRVRYPLICMEREIACNSGWQSVGLTWHTEIRSLARKLILRLKNYR